jgi:hypothetical protein
MFGTLEERLGIRVAFGGERGGGGSSFGKTVGEFVGTIAGGLLGRSKAGSLAGSYVGGKVGGAIGGAFGGISSKNGPYTSRSTHPSYRDYPGNYGYSFSGRDSRVGGSR